MQQVPIGWFSRLTLPRRQTLLSCDEVSFVAEGIGRLVKIAQVADEIDSQLSQAMASYVAESEREALAA